MKSLKYFETNEEYISGGGGKLLKPTELEPNHVIYVGDSGKVLYDSDYHSVVKIKYNKQSNVDRDYFLLEKLQDGTFTQHTLSGLSTGDIIELSPCKYGFCLSNYNYYSYVGFNIEGSYILPCFADEIDITDYDTSNIVDFRGMFVYSTVIGGESLNTCKGTNFDKMCLGSTLNKFPLTLSSNVTDANLYIPIYKFDTLDLSGGKLDSTFFNYTGTGKSNIFYYTNHFFDEYQYDYNKGKIKQTQTLTKIIADDENLARFVHYCANKQNLSFEFVKPNGEAWSFE